MSERVALQMGSLTYGDRRWKGFDAATLVEVIEHIEPHRLSALVMSLFADARPNLIVMTMPTLKQTLHLDLTGPAGDEADGTVYNFKLFDAKGELPHSGWFPVAKIITMKAGPAMVTWLRTEHGIEGDELERAYERLDWLHRVVHVENPLA